MAYAFIAGTWNSSTATASGTWQAELYYPSSISYPGGSVFKSGSGFYTGTWGPIAQTAGTSASYSVTTPVGNSSTTITAPGAVVGPGPTGPGPTGPGGGGNNTVNVPGIVGMNEENAEVALLNVGLGITYTYDSVGATKQNHGIVKSQNPAGGSVVNRGTTVTANFYNYPDWFKLGGTLTSNDGSAPGAYPGIWYYVEAKNEYYLDVRVSWSIEGTTLSGTQIITPENQYLWAPPSAAHLPADYNTTYRLVVTASATNGGVDFNPVETRSWQVTTPPVPITAPTWTDNTLGGFYVGEAYSDSVSAAGTSPSYSVSSGTLPAGITFSGGTLSGTPTTKGAYSFTITASNGAGSISASFSGTVNPAKGGVYVLVDGVWVDSTVRTLNGSGGSAAAEIYHYDGTNWVKSF